jgi:FMN-dependent NADH-azoreductase
MNATLIVRSIDFEGHSCSVVAFDNIFANYKIRQGNPTGIHEIALVGVAIPDLNDQIR